MLKAFAALALSLSAAACTVPKAQVHSTASWLGPQRSAVVVGQAARPAALEVVRLFASRGYAVLDTRTAEDGSLLVHIAGARRTATTVDETLHSLRVLAELGEAQPRDPQQIRHELEEDVLLGSAFYVHVKPLAPDQASIAIIGRPMHEGREACTADLPANCVDLEYDDAPAGELSGRAEAAIVNGVFAELRVAGVVLSPDPAIDEATVARDERCLQRRRELQELAGKISSDRARANVLRTMPTCTRGTLVAK